jgi:two-component system, NarL family, nitrate/nitrite response regulator NarL
MPTSVLVADPVALLRTGVRSALERAGGFAVSEAADEPSLLAAVVAELPELVLLDLHLPPSGGVAALAQFEPENGPRVIAWALDPDGDQVLAALSAGAIGFLTKDMTADAIVRGLHTALDGQAPIRRSLLTSVIVAFQKVERRDRYGERAVKLSARELEVLGLIALGTRNREIADQLGISEFTVKRHVQNILHKLNVPSREVAAHIYRSVFGAEGTPHLAATL